MSLLSCDRGRRLVEGRFARREMQSHGDGRGQGRLQGRLSGGTQEIDLDKGHCSSGADVAYKHGEKEGKAKEGTKSEMNGMGFQWVKESVEFCKDFARECLKTHGGTIEEKWLRPGRSTHRGTYACTGTCTCMCEYGTVAAHMGHIQTDSTKKATKLASGPRGCDPGPSKVIAVI